MKTIKIIFVIVLFTAIGYGQATVPTTLTGQPIFASSDSNYAAFAAANFNYLRLDTSTIGKKKLKYFNREFHFWKTRLGNTSSAGNTKEYAMAINSLKNYPCTTTDSADWICEGPFNSKRYSTGTITHQMGLISAVYMQPNNQNILIGSNTSGIWRTTDKGVTWTNVTNNLRIPTLGISNFSIHPTNPNIILAGTGRSKSAVNQLSYGPTILKTIDGGMTWSEMNLSSSTFSFTEGKINKAIFNPSNANEIFVIQDGTNGGLYKSTNGGGSFTKIFSMTVASNAFVDFQQSISDIEILSNGNIILSCRGEWGGYADSYLYNVNASSWQKLFLQPSIQKHIKVIDTNYIAEVQISTPIYDSIVYLGIVKLNKSGTPHFDSLLVFKSTNYGNTFSEYASILNPREAKAGKLEIEASPQFLNRIYIGSIEFFSLDKDSVNWFYEKGGDTTWNLKQLSGDYKSDHIDIRAMQVMKNIARDEIVLLGNDGGISLHKTANGFTKESLNGMNLPITQFYRLGLSQFKSKLEFNLGKKLKFIGGSQDNSNFMILYNTGSWESTAGGDGHTSWINFDGTKYISSSNSITNYHYPRYTGFVWNQSSISVSFGSWFLDRPVKVIKNGVKTYASSNDSFRSYNPSSGANFTTTIPNIKDIGVIGVDEENPDLVWIAENEVKSITPDKFFKSINGGVSFTNMTAKPVYFQTSSGQQSATISNILDYKTITDIEINPKNNQEIFASIAGVYDAANDSWATAVSSAKKQIRVIHSTDGGNTWHDWSKGLPKPRIPVNDLIYHKGSDGLVFAATDMGVYYRNINDTDSKWRCFQTGLPPIIVTDMQINYCENKIYCATFGRGIYSSDIPESILNRNSEKILTVNTLYDYSIFAPYDIRVKSGVTLTITDTLNFSGGRKLIVEEGAKLIINGGKITNRCGDYWQGIFAQGDRTKSQNPLNQSIIQLNSATLENARTAISTTNPYAWGSHGAIIRAANSTFLNNKKDVELMLYHNTFVGTSGAEVDNQSQFVNCNFFTDTNFVFTSTDSRISMWQVNGVKIRGCVFNDKRPTGVAREEGIFSFDATFKVDHICNTTISPCTSFKKTTFNNFNYGIHAMGTGPMKHITIKNSEFSNYWSSIMLEGTNSAKVLNNTINTDYSNSYGVYLMASNDYQIEGNEFKTNPTSSTYNFTIGTVVYNKHGNDNQVYRNSYEKNQEGIETLGQNKELQGLVEKGLVLKCNDFTLSTSDDIYVTRDPRDLTYYPYFGIKRLQGIPSGATHELAGNLFSNNSTLVYGINNEEDWFNYFHHDEVVTPRVKPSKISPFVYLVGSSNPKIPSSCPDKTNPTSVTIGNVIGLIQANKNLEIQNIATLQALVDGGNTELLETQVSTANNSSAYQTYLDIMAEAGYVSEEVLMEVAESESLTLAMIRDILVANPHAAESEEIQQILDDRLNELTPFMRIQIMAGLNQVSPLEYMQQVISKYSTRKNEAIRLALQLLRDDSTATVADFESVLLNTNNVYYDLEMVEIYDYKGNTQAAAELLVSMETNNEFTEPFMEYFNDFKSLRATMQSWNIENTFNLEEDKIQELEIYALKDNPTSATARKLLYVNGRAIDQEPIIFSDPSNRSVKRKPRTFNVNGLEINEFNLFPNPTKNFVTLDYSLAEAGKKIKFIMVNSIGKVIKTKELIASKDQVVIKLDKLPVGDYIGFITVDGKSIGTKKLTITK